MSDPANEPPGTDRQALQLVASAAESYLLTVPARPAAATLRAHAATEPLASFPQRGWGTLPAVRALVRSAAEGATTTTGPRYFDYVVGGATPAAMAADWLATIIDQNAAGPGSSAWATELEAITLEWLVELFGLPRYWSAALTTSSMFATFTGLSCATRWWGSQHGVDVAEDGLANLPPLTVFASPRIHPTVRKALQMLGHGRRCVRVCADASGRGLDLDGLHRTLNQHTAPCVIIATAADAGTGTFDPIAEMADVSEQHEAWLHVDGAFGLYAALSNRRRHLLRGVERADSIAADAHKWLNVPYESGFCLLKRPELLEPTFGMPEAPYLPSDDGFRGFAVRGPESSRRARALPIWASLAAYGADGLGKMAERHLDILGHLAERIAAEPRLDLAYEPVWCVACFRWVGATPPGVCVDEFNRTVAAAVCRDGVFVVGTTVHDDRVMLRVAIVSWRVTTTEIDDLVDTVVRVAEQPS